MSPLLSSLYLKNMALENGTPSLSPETSHFTSELSSLERSTIERLSEEVAQLKRQLADERNNAMDAKELLELCRTSQNKMSMTTATAALMREKAIMEETVHGSREEQENGGAGVAAAAVTTVELKGMEELLEQLRAFCTETQRINLPM